MGDLLVRPFSVCKITGKLTFFFGISSAIVLAWRNDPWVIDFRLFFLCPRRTRQWQAQTNFVDNNEGLVTIQILWPIYAHPWRLIVNNWVSNIEAGFTNHMLNILIWLIIKSYLKLLVIVIISHCFIHEIGDINLDPMQMLSDALGELITAWTIFE